MNKDDLGVEDTVLADFLAHHNIPRSMFTVSTLQGSFETTYPIREVCDKISHSDVSRLNFGVQPTIIISNQFPCIAAIVSTWTELTIS